MLKKSVEMFISTLKVTEEKAREIEANTRDQRLSPQWFAACRFQLTASMFGSVVTRKPDTPPNNLVLRIIQPKSFSSEATKHGIDSESVAIKCYVNHRIANGCPDLQVGSQCGFYIVSSYLFLGASPDGSVYDPCDPHQSLAFWISNVHNIHLRIKLLYKPVNLPRFFFSFCCTDTLTGQVLLKKITSNMLKCMVKWL